MVVVVVVVVVDVVVVVVDVVVVVAVVVVVVVVVVAGEVVVVLVVVVVEVVEVVVVVQHHKNHGHDLPVLVVAVVVGVVVEVVHDPHVIGQTSRIGFDCGCPPTNSLERDTLNSVKVQACWRFGQSWWSVSPLHRRMVDVVVDVVVILDVSVDVEEEVDGVQAPQVAAQACAINKPVSPTVIVIDELLQRLTNSARPSPRASTVHMAMSATPLQVGTVVLGMKEVTVGAVGSVDDSVLNDVLLDVLVAMRVDVRVLGVDGLVVVQVLQVTGQASATCLGSVSFSSVTRFSTNPQAARSNSHSLASDLPLHFS